ncbi:PH domain leucine-rich repeat-containing protein phosphatase 2-like [Garra rufa]|uniref:PH domain leucine-rich repeat-containing protein phosphatase 2-like n=1 Tax=Garra rufa TaxID=137080 RepID=UPI003CCEE131
MNWFIGGFSSVGEPHLCCLTVTLQLKIHFQALIGGHLDILHYRKLSSALRQALLLQLRRIPRFSVSRSVFFQITRYDVSQLSSLCFSTLGYTRLCTVTQKPVNADQQERTLLKGVFSVRKGKTQLHKWAERQVILCGTSLIVASVKDSLTGKMHILPLVGGKVEEVKRRQHCLMFSSAGPQAQTYYVNFDTLADYQRWHRQASKCLNDEVNS